MDFSEFIRQFSPPGMDNFTVYAPPEFYEQLAAHLGGRIDSQLREQYSELPAPQEPTSFTREVLEEALSRVSVGDVIRWAAPGITRAEAAWFEPNRGESAPPGHKDLMSMSEAEIDAYWDEQERQLETMEGLNNEENTALRARGRFRGLSPDSFIFDNLWPNNIGLTQSPDDMGSTDDEY